MHGLTSAKMRSYHNDHPYPPRIIGGEDAGDQEGVGDAGGDIVAGDMVGDGTFDGKVWSPPDDCDNPKTVVSILYILKAVLAINPDDHDMVLQAVSVYINTNRDCCTRRRPQYSHSIS